MQKKYWVLIFLLFLQSCCPESLSHTDANAMINIAKFRSCNCGSSITFDVCIDRIQTPFDKLSKSERNQVALNFVIYGKLNNSSALSFAQLIAPYHKETIIFLSTVKDSELENKFSMNEDDIINYREFVKFLSKMKENR